MVSLRTRVYSRLFIASYLVFIIATSSICSFNVECKKENSMTSTVEALSSSSSSSGTGENLFDLIPGRYPDTISLPIFLDSVAQGPDGLQMLEFISSFLRSHLGVQIPPNELSSLINDTSPLLNYFNLDILQLHEAAEALNLAYQLGELPPTEAPSSPPFILPSIDLLTTNLSTIKGFDLDSFLPKLTQLYFPSSGSSSSGSSSDEEVPTPFFLGWTLNQTTSSEALTQSIIISQALNQLSNNFNLTSPSDELYVIQADGNNFTDPFQLMTYLVDKTDHQLSSYYECRVADFLSIWYNNSDTGILSQVAFPLMMKTGIFNKSNGEEAVIPAFHCALIFRLEGSVLNTEISWYEGIDGIGFFPWNLEYTPSWLGEYQSPNAPATLTGDQALPLFQYTTLLQTVLLRAAVMFDLYLYGYGATGVCVDSVSTVLNVLNPSTINFYPLLMEKGLVDSAILDISQRVNGTSLGYILPALADLTSAVSRLPTDYLPQPKSNQAQRLLDIIPWNEGEEPFQCAVDARVLLANCVALGDSC